MKTPKQTRMLWDEPSATLASEFQGDKLRLAREFRGQTQTTLGRRVEVSPALLSFFESGRRIPSCNHVDSLSSALGFEPAFFYQPVRDPFRPEECNFRHRRSTSVSLKTQIAARATLVGMIIRGLRERVRFPELDVPSFSATTPEEIEAAADASRSHWGVHLDSPLKQVGRLMEHAGVILVTKRLDVRKVDAFSRFGPSTLIFLNEATNSPSRWAFDIAHECAHLVMHRGQVTGNKQTEADADRFASAFLMPQHAFRREFAAAKFSWRNIFDLKRRWGASLAAIVRRAYDLSLISAVEYRRANQYMSSKGWRRAGEPEEPHFQPPSLLEDAFKILKQRDTGELHKLRSDLGFPVDTFNDIAGASVVASPDRASVVEFARG